MRLSMSGYLFRVSSWHLLPGSVPEHLPGQRLKTAILRRNSATIVFDNFRNAEIEPENHLLANLGKFSDNLALKKR